VESPPEDPISPAVPRLVGKLCVGWSYLEAETEMLIWGIADADQTTGPNLTWHLNLQDRWKLILQRAHEKHGESDLPRLRKLKEKIDVLVRDRNIIVHGLVHGKISIPNVPTESPTTVLPPVWTIFRGPDAGKNFPISESAVKIVYYIGCPRGSKAKIAANKVTQSLEYVFSRDVIALD